MLVGGIDSVATIALTSILSAVVPTGAGIGDMVFKAGIWSSAPHRRLQRFRRCPAADPLPGDPRYPTDRGGPHVLTNGLVIPTSPPLQFIGGEDPGIHTYHLRCPVADRRPVNKTTLGRRIYAVGSNREAARYSGINVNATLMMAYILSGIIAGFAGIVYTSRLNCAEPTIGSEFAQEAIAAAAIGGISFKGGHGNVFGVVVGALILTLITNGMTLLSIDSNWQVGATGVIIILAVLIDRNT